MNNFLLRLANDKDIDQLIMINIKYQKKNLSLEQLKCGFIGFLYDENDFKNIIKEEEIVVACYNNKIVGYYLINSKCHKKNHQNQIKIVSDLKKSGFLKTSDRIVIGSQAIIEKSFRGKGLSNLLLNKLIKITENRYDYFFSCISRINEKAYHIHTKEGWEKIAEDEAYYYVLLNTKPS